MLRDAPQTCLDGYPGNLALSLHKQPNISYDPDLLEGDIMVHLKVDGARRSLTPASLTTTAWSGTALKGVIMWNMSAKLNDDDITWTVFPSVGLLYPGDT